MQKPDYRSFKLYSFFLTHQKTTSYLDKSNQELTQLVSRKPQHNFKSKACHILSFKCVNSKTAKNPLRLVESDSLPRPLAWLYLTGVFKIIKPASSYLYHLQFFFEMCGLRNRK